MTDTNLLEIFCIFDEFCKYFAPKLKKHSLEVPDKRHRNRPCRMSDSEIMTILVLFHTRRFRDLKSFYLGYVCRHLRKDFPHTISYNRFVERQAQVAMQLLLFLQTCALGKCTGISIIVSPLGLLPHQAGATAQDHEGMGGKGYNKAQEEHEELTDDLYDKILLRKRTLRETVNDELKNVCHIKHTRHRSVENFVTNLLAGLIAYNLLPKKPSMNIDIIDKSRLIA